jgi:hypothetical protein
MDYIQRSNESLGKMIADKQTSKSDELASVSMKLWQQTFLRFRHNN